MPPSSWRQARLHRSLAFYYSNPPSPKAEKRHTAHETCTASDRRIRSPAGEPRRLRVSTGHSPRAAFRIRPPPKQKKDTPKGGGRFDRGGRIRYICSLREQIKELPPSSWRQARLHRSLAFYYSNPPSPKAEKRHTAHETCTASDRRIRSPAGEPRRLRVSTGHSPRAAFRILCPPPPKKRHTFRCVSFLVGEDGFEPSKRYAADLQSVPFGHSGTPPYSILSDEFKSDWSR